MILQIYNSVLPMIFFFLLHCFLLSTSYVTHVILSTVLSIPLSVRC